MAEAALRHSLPYAGRDVFGNLRCCTATRNAGKRRRARALFEHVHAGPDLVDEEAGVALGVLEPRAQRLWVHRGERGEGRAGRRVDPHACRHAWLFALARERHREEDARVEARHRESRVGVSVAVHRARDASGGSVFYSDQKKSAWVDARARVLTPTLLRRSRSRDATGGRDNRRPPLEHPFGPLSARWPWPSALSARWPSPSARHAHPAVRVEPGERVVVDLTQPVSVRSAPSSSTGLAAR